MTIDNALKKGAERLRNLERPLLQSEILLSFVLKKERIFLHQNAKKELDSFDEATFFRFIKRRENHEPLEYLTELVSFYENTFYVSYGALIPRPETEILVEKARALIEQKGIMNVAEIGIGSGAISISLAKLFPKVNFYASDISPFALFNAFMNLKKFNLENLKLFRSNLLDFMKNEKIEMLISNPPYIANSYILPKEVQKEPQIALFGGENGDEILHKIIELAYCKKIPYLLCEMGYNQKKSILDFVEKMPYEKIEFYKDFAGLDRGFVIEFLGIKDAE